MSDVIPDLLMRLLIDQSERWGRGQPYSIETYLQQHPTLANDDEHLLDLISNEIYIRCTRGEAPDPRGYRERFPRLSEQIDLQFQLHQAAGLLGGDVLSQDGRSLSEPGKMAPAKGMPAIPGYELIEEIGRGGMGVVYQARQISLSRVVALKVVAMGGKNRALLQARFRVEAEAVARLQHTNIVQIFEIGEHENCSYFSLELVDGGNLAQRLKVARPSEIEIAWCMVTLALAVQYAHQRGVVHRDLKPANILITKDGLLKITDFGLARQLTTNQRLTQFGDILGTPSYMAPEQAWGNRQVGEPADIYSLGAILFEMLTEQPPFTGETAFGTLLRVSTEPSPAPVDLRPLVSPELNAICSKCLRKNPEDRYTSASALAEDLQRFLDGRPVQALPSSAGTRMMKWLRRSPARAALFAGALLAVVALAAEGIFHARRLQNEREQAKRDTQALLDQASAISATRSEIETQRDEARQMTRRLELQRDEAYEAVRSAEAERDTARLQLRQGAPPNDGEREAARRAEEAAELKQRQAMLRLEQLRRELYAQQLLEAAAIWPLEPERARTILQNESRCPVELRDFTWGLLQSCCDPPHSILEGHAKNVCALAAAAHGKTLVSAGVDGSVRLWDIEAGVELNSLVGHRGAVHAVAFAPKVRLLATAGADHSVWIWDSAGSALYTLHGHKRAVNALAFTANGKVLASAGEEGTIRLWDAVTGKDIADLAAHQGAIHALAYSADGKTLVSAGNDAIIKFWDQKKRTQIGFLNGHTSSIRALAFSPDGKLLASAGADESVRVWNMTTHTANHILAGQKGRVNALAFSADGKVLAVGSEDSAPINNEAAGTVRFWDPAAGQLLAAIPSKEAVASIAFFPNGKLAIASGHAIDIRQPLWRAERSTFHVSDSALQAFAFAPDGKSFAAAGEDQMIRLMDQTNASVRQTFKGHVGPVTALNFKPDGNTLVSGSADGSLRLWSADNGKLLKTLEAHAGGVDCLAFSRDGALLASGGRDHRVKLWNQITGEATATLTGHSQDVTSLAFAPNGQTLATASSDGGLMLWRTATGELIRTLQTTGEGIQALTFMPDGVTLAAGCQDGAVRLWDVTTGKVVRTLAGHRGAAWCMALSPDGKTLAAGAGTKGADAVRLAGEVRLWDPVAGQLRAVLTGHSKAVTSVGFSTDGRLLGSVSVDMTTKIWESRDR